MGQKRLRQTAIALGLLGLGACSGGPEAPPADTAPPAAVTDLAVAAAVRDSVVLTWTAPGDDGPAGRARAYDLRCAPCDLCGETWSAALPLGGAPEPAPAGTPETAILRDLPCGVPLKVALRATDDAGNWSGLSNLVEVFLPDTVRIVLEPASAVVALGGTCSWRAVVTGTPDTTVTWSVDEGPGHGTISAGGRFSAPDALPFPPAATVRATSTADPGASATAAVTLVLPRPAPEGFVTLPAGDFVMGDGEAWCGVIEHPVRLTEAFHLGATEVTNVQYLELAQWAYDHGLVHATVSRVTDLLDGSDVELLDMDPARCEIGFRDGVFHLVDAGHGRANRDHPAKGVTWYGAAAYCDWLSLREGLPRAYDHATWVCGGGDPYRARGYRLPTNAEWEYAAQYDDERIYPWGDDPPTCDHANFSGCNEGWTEPVATQPAGPEKRIDGRGLYDMAGNVWEWCNDWWACESIPGAVDPIGPPDGTNRMYRGGAWSSGPVIVLRAAARDDRGAPWGCSSIIGFRVARTVAP